MNEQEAIGSTISRCLEAIEGIKSQGKVSDVEIIVVNDGSTDNTEQIAKGFSGVQVISFEKNRGYGAAIKEGFRQSTGTLVSFLDADGTCDPRFFGTLCQRIREDNADIALGSRLGPDSKMPLVRRIGNRLYALLLGLLCGRHVTDTASGMRVIRRSSLAKLYPLPDGLHFTPSMSARALVSGLTLVEIPMHYEERIGQSKLNVIHDGIRFLKTILSGILCFRPERLFLMGFLFCLFAGVILAAYPVEYYLKHQQVQEWMIYRFLACTLLGTMAYLLLCSVALVQKMHTIGPVRLEKSLWPVLVLSLFEGRIRYWIMGMMIIIAIGFLRPGIIEYLKTATVTLHWSRTIVGIFFLIVAFEKLLTCVLIEVVSIWKYQTIENKHDTEELQKVA